MDNEIRMNQFQDKVIELIVEKIKENATSNETIKEIILSDEEISKFQGFSKDVAGDLKELCMALIGYVIRENAEDGKYIAYPPVLEACYKDGKFKVVFNKLFFES